MIAGIVSVPMFGLRHTLWRRNNPMLKSFLFYGICLLPIALGVKVYINMVRFEDEHRLIVLACMRDAEKELDLSPHDAYIACETEE
jgi:hypothetical protein